MRFNVNYMILLELVNADEDLIKMVNLINVILCIHHSEEDDDYTW